MGQGIAIPHSVTTTSSEPVGVVCADLDGDRDLLTNERNGDRLWWFENALGAGEFWIPHLMDEGSDGPGDVTAAFIDGDGTVDVAGSFSWDHAIRWYRLAENYADAGELSSSILDLGAPVKTWEQIEWNCETPSSTSMQIDVRASADAAKMGDWIAVAASGDPLSDYLAEGAQYFQYRLVLTSNDDTVSLRFDGISIYFKN